MHALSQFGFDLVQLCLQSLTVRVPPHGEPSGVPLLRTDVREAEEIERLRLPQATSLPSFGGVCAEFEQSRFLGVQFQTKLRESLREIRPESLGIRLDLESQHDVIRVAHDNDVAARLLPTPCVDPQVKHVVEIDVRQLRRYHAPYTKGNFQFERVIAGWREQPVLDLRRK